MTTFIPEGRLGNWLFKLAATIGYARKHGLEYTVPTTSRDAFWCPVYHQHLVNPKFDPSLDTVVVKENGFPFQELPFNESWRGKNIVLDGYFQSELYFRAYREEVLKAFGFPWNNDREGVVAVHVRRSDALKYPEKHIILSKEYYEAQMAKFGAGHSFHFFSDDMPWCVENFGGRTDCFFRLPFKFYDVGDSRPEVQDLIAASNCGHLIGSSSTFAVWIGLLQQNPNARRIFPKQWMVEGWQGTTSKDWADVVPTSFERA